MNTTPADLRSHFRSLIGKGKRFSTNAHMARFLGLTPTTCTKLYSFLKGADTQYSAVLGWLESLGGQVILPREKLPHILVPRTLGTGEAALGLAREESRSLYAFRRDMLEREGISPEECVLAQVSGDSMDPLIREGDTILVDESAREPKDGQIFMVELGGAPLVKRLAKIPDGWRLCAENRNRPDTDVRGSELGGLRFHGRVRWVGRIL